MLYIQDQICFEILIMTVGSKRMLLTFYHLIHEWASVRHSCFLNPLNPYKLQSHPTKDVSKIYQQSSVFDSWPTIYKIVIGAWCFFIKYYCFNNVKSEPITVIVYLQQIANQIYSLTRNFSPWMGRIHKRRILDLFINIFIFVEWKSSW